MSRSAKRREMRLRATLYAMVQEALRSKTDAGFDATPAIQTPLGERNGPPSDHTPSGITIEHGIPIPQKSSVGRWKGIYDELAPGASFVTTPSDARAFVYAAGTFGGRTATRTVKDGKCSMVRVWLVEKNVKPVA